MVMPLLMHVHLHAGGLVLIVNGAYRVSEAELLEIDTSKFKAQLRITKGPYKGLEPWVEYEDFSKLSSS
jgi:DNA/RNA-binding protein KIN17